MAVMTLMRLTKGATLHASIVHQFINVDNSSLGGYRHLPVLRVTMTQAISMSTRAMKSDGR